MRNVGEYVEARTRGGIKESMRERGEIRLDEKRINRYPWQQYRGDASTRPLTRTSTQRETIFHEETKIRDPLSVIGSKFETRPFKRRACCSVQLLNTDSNPPKLNVCLSEVCDKYRGNEFHHRLQIYHPPLFSPVCFIDATIKRRRGKSWPRASLSKTSPSPDSIHVNLRLHLYRFFSLFFLLEERQSVGGRFSRWVSGG